MHQMSKNRLEAFSDGLIAIIITVMVLEMKVPHGADWNALRPILPVFLSYVLSFLYLGIYWNNHHHLLHTVISVDGKIMWANMNLLFWLSLIPFTTGWMGENYTQALPAALYGVVLFMAAVSYKILQTLIIASQGKNSLLAAAIKDDLKGKISIGLYLLGVLLAFVNPWMADVIYLTVALMWLVPDRRIEKLVSS